MSSPGPITEIGPYRYTDEDVERTLLLASSFFHLLPGGFSAVDGWPAAPHQARVEATIESIGADDPAAALAVVVEEWFAGVDALRRTGAFGPPAVGAVTGLFTSGGGVPKVPQDELVISWAGAEGDVQDDRSNHGRPWQALCLWSAEVVDQFAAAGNPIHPGAAGENISLSGISWDRVVPGVHLRLGDVLVVVSAYALPCHKNAQWFAHGRFDAMHHRHGPISRVYATVLEPGTIRMGDAVLLEPPR